METVDGTKTRTFIWSMFGPDLIARFERFSKLALVDGKHVTSALSSLIEEHLENHDIPGTLVDEKELLDALQREGTPVSRVTLRNYRNRLQKDGKPIWYTDGRNICYHLEDCLDFFRTLKGRKKAA